MTFYADRVPKLKPGSAGRSPNGPCRDLNHVDLHKHEPEFRAHHGHRLILWAVTALFLLLILGNAFLGYHFFNNSVTGSAIIVNVGRGNAPLLSTQALSLSDEEGVLTELYEIAAPATVKILVANRGQLDLTNPNVRGDGVGSGFIFDSEGHIVTNSHVVDEAADVAVQLANGRVVRAQVLGQDLSTDLAVLEIDVSAEELATVPLADSNTLRVGQTAIVIGHPFGLDKSLTVGHISGLGRMTPSKDKYSPVIENMIQTDAAINPGNSGGPMFNLKGEVVGINASIFSTSRGWQGVGFAIPSNTARSVVAELLERGYVSRPFLGIVGLPLDAQSAARLGLEVERGLLIQDVSEGSGAWQAGVRPGKEQVRLGRWSIRVGGDILTAVDGQPVASMAALANLLQHRAAGDAVTLRVVRAGEETEVVVILGDRSDLAR